MAFTDDELRAIESVRTYVQEYVEKEDVNVQWLAEKSGIPVTTLHRAYSRLYPLKHHYFRSLLNVITGSEKKTISVMFEIPYYRKYAERQRIYIECIDNITDPIEKALVNTTTFKLAFLATFGTSYDEIRDVYGSNGVLTLNKLIETKALDRTEDGSVMLPDYNIPSLDSAIDIMSNIMSFMKENSEMIDEIKLTFHRIESSVYSEIINDVRDVSNRISLKMQACDNKGDKKAVFGVFLANIN